MIKQYQLDQPIDITVFGSNVLLTNAVKKLRKAERRLRYAEKSPRCNPLVYRTRWQRLFKAEKSFQSTLRSNFVRRVDINVSRWPWITIDQAYSMTLSEDLLKDLRFNAFQSLQEFLIYIKTAVSSYQRYLCKVNEWPSFDFAIGKLTRLLLEKLVGETVTFTLPNSDVNVQLVVSAATFNWDWDNPELTLHFDYMSQFVPVVGSKGNFPIFQTLNQTNLIFEKATITDRLIQLEVTTHNEIANQVVDFDLSNVL